MSIASRIARHLPHRIAANASPFGGTTGDGLSIVEFTPTLVETIRLGFERASLERLYRTQPAVRTCVSFLALSIAPLNLKVYRRVAGGTPTPVYDHPLQRLLQRPNEWTTRFELVRDTVSDIAIYAEGYWLKVGVGDRRALLRLPPTYVEIRGGDVLTGPAGYTIRNPQTGTSFTAGTDEVVHFRGYSPTDTRIGTSPLESLRYVLNEDIEASKHRAFYWRNHAGRDGVIERPPAAEAGEWSDDARERFLEDWRNRHTGAANAGKTPILEDGMKWNPDSFSPKDSEYIAGREFTLDTVATAYHIPLTVLSRKSTATFASAKEFHKMLYVDTLGPWNAMLEGAIGLQLVADYPDGDDLYVEFNIDEKLQGDFEQQADAARQAVQVPWMSADEMRAKRGLPPLGGPYADPARPTNYQYEGEPEPGPEGDDREPGEPGEAVAATNGHLDDAALWAALEER